MAQAAPLVDRPEDAALFLMPAGMVRSSAFLAEANAVARALPDAEHLLNLCRDRYAFALAFAAALLRGQACLLCGDGALLPVLACQYPAVNDEAVWAARTGAGDQINPLIPADRLAAIVFTSGSTGAPTAHRKHWGALVARSRSAGERFALSKSAPASIVGTVPPHHMYGFETTILLPLHAPCASWCGGAFFPGDVQAALGAVEAPRILVTTPLQMRVLLQGGDPPRLAGCISATAPLEPALAGEAEARWHAPMREIFGATECGSIASRRTVEGEGWTLYDGVRLQHCAGSTEVVANGADPVPLADEIEMLGPDRFRLLGRRADVVKLGGRRASLSGLNRILTGLAGVRDGIFIVPDDLDQRSTARLLAVVVAPERSGPSILAELRGHLDPLFLPRRVVHVDALPRNELGKLPRQALLDLLARTEAR